MAKNKPKPYAAQVREVIAAAGADGIARPDLDEAVDAVFNSDRRRLNNVIRDLKRYDKITVSGSGKAARYTIIGPPDLAGKAGPTKAEVMWRILRARRSVTIADLVELSGSADSYALEWIKHLAKNEVVRKEKDHWVLIDTKPRQIPENTTKADRLRRLRAARKRATAAMDQAFAAIAEARMAITEMEGDAE